MNARLSRHARLIALGAAASATAVAGTASAYHDDEQRWTQHTANVVRPTEVELGVLAADVGLHPGAQVGTDTLPWAAGLFLPVVVPNAHIKVNPLPESPVSVALRGAIYYAPVLKDDGTRANVFVLPVSLFGSFEVTRKLGIHVEGQYTFLTGTGEAQPDQLAIAGGAASAALQFGAMAMVRITRVVAVYGRGRWQAWQQAPRVDATTTVDQYTSASTEANIKTTYADGAWQAIGGVAMSWASANLELGVGYGDAFLPGWGVVVPYKGVIPDANLFFRF